jgi:hypothetical protein
VALDDAPCRFCLLTRTCCPAVVPSLHVQPCMPPLLAGDAHTLPSNVATLFSPASSECQMILLELLKVGLLVVTLNSNDHVTGPASSNPRPRRLYRSPKMASPPRILRGHLPREKKNRSVNTQTRYITAHNSASTLTRDINSKGSE